LLVRTAKREHLLVTYVHMNRNVSVRTTYYASVSLSLVLGPFLVCEIFFFGLQKNTNYNGLTKMQKSGDEMSILSYLGNHKIVNLSQKSFQLMVPGIGFNRFLGPPKYFAMLYGP
jgi:hypothetical protein